MGTTPIIHSTVCAHMRPVRRNVNVSVRRSFIAAVNSNCFGSAAAGRPVGAPAAVAMQRPIIIDSAETAACRSIKTGRSIVGQKN